MNLKDILAEAESAAKFEHPQRLMRVTLECAHFRLQTFNDCLGGIGWSTACHICSEAKDKQVTRTIVNVEETGVL